MPPAFGHGRQIRARAHDLYCLLVAQARRPEFYRRLGVPDTLDGRFEMLVLHLHLVLRCLRDAGTEGTRLAQALFDVMFADMDRSLREMGVGDLSVGGRVKAMARAFYGRAAAYDQGLETGGLEAALTRNVYGTVTPQPGQAAALAAYVRRAAAALMARGAEALLDGEVSFGPPLQPGENGGPAREGA